MPKNLQNYEPPTRTDYSVEKKDLKNGIFLKPGDVFNLNVTKKQLDYNYITARYLEIPKKDS